MTEEELRAFADVMVEKAALGHGFVDGRFTWRPGDAAEAFREMIFNVVVDTEMMVTGAPPLEKWLEKETVA